MIIIIIQHLFSTMTSLEDTEVPVAPSRVWEQVGFEMAFDRLQVMTRFNVSGQGVPSLCCCDRECSTGVRPPQVA